MFIFQWRDCPDLGEKGLEEVRLCRATLSEDLNSLETEARGGYN